MLEEIQTEIDDLKTSILSIKSIFEEWVVTKNDNKQNYSDLSIWEVIELVNNNPINDPFLFEQQQQLILLLKKLANLEQKVKVLEYKENINAELDELKQKNNESKPD